MFPDKLFKKIEGKTNVSKDSIISLAKKVQNSDMKDETVLRDLIKDISKIAGKSVSKEKEDKIISTIINDNVNKELNKFVN